LVKIVKSLKSHSCGVNRELSHEIVSFVNYTCVLTCCIMSKLI